MHAPRHPTAVAVSAALLLAVAGAGTATGAKAPRPGDRCTRPGFSARVGGRTWTCRRKGHAGVWVVTPPLRGRGSSGGGGSAPSAGDAATAQVVTASPFDLAQVRAISKFRSCSGHDYSGLDIQGHVETNRSMKHYVVPTAAALASPGLMNAYAPFAGTVVQIQAEQVPIGRQIWIDSADGRWEARIFHTDPVVQQGQTVAAGALIGHPAFPAAVYGNPNAFVSVDISLVYRAPNVQGEVLDSILAHMTPGVGAQWAARGVTAGDAIVTQAARDAAPCTGFSNYGPDDYVTLTP